MTSPPDNKNDDKNKPVPEEVNLGEIITQEEKESEGFSQNVAQEPAEIVTVSKKAGMVGFYTFLSRIFGLGRDTLIAYLLGAKEAADAFYVAFRIPNLLRRLLAEGALTISFIPVFSEYLKKDKKEAKEIADYTFTILTLILFLITVIGVVFAAFFVKATAFGFTEDPQKYELTVQLTRITFPYIFLVSLGALAMGILNSLKHFSTPAAAPILLNVGIILSALLLRNHVSQPSTALAIGVIVGGTLQILLQIPALYKLGFLPRFAWNPKHPGLVKIAKLLIPSIYGSAVYQLNLFAMTFMASFLATGSVSYLWYADRVMEFPLGVFAISFATVILPQLSDHAADKNMTKFKAAFIDGLRMITFINLPACVGLIVLAELIIAVLFQHGSFNAESTLLTARALQCFAIGLPFVSASRITSSAFYALQDSKTPVRAANIAVFANIAMGALLLKPFGHIGLALGVTFGSLSNLLLQMRDFRKKMGFLGLKKILPSFIKMFIASAGMGAALYYLQPLLRASLGPSVVSRLMALILLIVLGVGVYFLLAKILRIPEAEHFEKLLLRRFKRKI